MLLSASTKCPQQSHQNLLLQVRRSRDANLERHQDRETGAAEVLPFEVLGGEGKPGRPGQVTGTLTWRKGSVFIV